jgi:methyltransferase family protein
MSKISELQAGMQRCDEELRALRESLAPAENEQHQRVKELRTEWLTAFERLQMMQPYLRIANYEVDTEVAYADYFRAVQSGDRERDAALEDDLRAEVRRAAPTSLDDPRLVGWYHTVDLGDGLHSTGRYDLRSTVDRHGLPESLDGKSALDVGTADGFWAFEMERRGADRVVGMDIELLTDFDYLPAVKETLRPILSKPLDRHFWYSHALLASEAEHANCSVYELSPDSVGIFDVVFCGSLLLHLMNPLEALVHIRSVTREMAVVATQLSEEAEALAPDKPLLKFGNRRPDLAGSRPLLGASCVYWLLNTTTLREMMEYAGFSRTEALEPVALPPMGGRCAVVVGYP